jgi:acylphosphatase
MGWFRRRITLTIPNSVHLARVHIWVTGRVQGVGFRAFVLQSGPLFGLTGWVHNIGYDQVETVAEGPREVLERFLQVVKTGPRASRVDEARVEWETPTGEFEGFEVR